jgi:hypothetical protein
MAMEHIEHPPMAGNEPQEERKIGVEKSLWGPRITGMVLAFVTLLGVNFVGFSPPESMFNYGIWAVIVLPIAVAAFFWKGRKSVIAVRWWAKIVGTCVAALLALLLFGEGGFPPAWFPPVLTISAVVFDLLPWVLLFPGVMIAFRWELIGGVLIALAGLILQIQGFFVLGSGLGFGAIFVFTGLGLVYCWWRTHRLSMQTPA